MHRSRGFIGALVVIVMGILLTLFLMGYFTSQHPYGVLPNYEDTLDLPCGVTILAPKDGETVSFPYTVRGYANGCGWGNYEGVAGRLDILHSIGVSMGTLLLPIHGESTQEPYYFEETFTLALPKNTTRGTFIFHPAGGGFGAQTERIPVIFDTEK